MYERVTDVSKRHDERCNMRKNDQIVRRVNRETRGGCERAREKVRERKRESE